MITVRAATNADIDSIMPVINQAQGFLAFQNIDQWQDDFPNRSVVEKDINSAEAYLLESDGKIAGYFVLYAPPEPVYANLEDGSWINDTDSYGAMHRVAISDEFRGKGLAKIIYDTCEKRSRELGYRSLRVDTHPDNKIMRHLATAHGFGECGYVYYPGNLKRIAFEKLL